MGEGTDRLFLQSFESSLLCLSRRMWLTAALVGALIALAVSAFFHPFWMISIASRLYRDIIWLGPSNSKDASSKPRIFLTIDDAPSGPRTNEILAALKKYDAKATFFCIGSHIEQYESEFNQIVASGHSVGNHTMFDRKSIDLTASELDCEIKTTDALIEKGFTKMKVSRPPPHLRFFRPGHGVWNKTLLDITKKHGLKVVLGSIYPWDPQIRIWWIIVAIIKIRLFFASPKESHILIVHDHPWGPKVINVIVPHLIKKGYEIVSLDSLYD